MEKGVKRHEWVGTVGITLTRPLKEGVKVAAQRDDRSVSAELRVLIAEALTARGLWPVTEERNDGQ